MAMTPDELIDTSMMLIVHSGDARAAAFHALQEAKAGNYEEAKKLMAESQEKALEAHHIQTGLLTAVNLLFHAAEKAGRRAVDLAHDAGATQGLAHGGQFRQLNFTGNADQFVGVAVDVKVVQLIGNNTVCHALLPPLRS